MFGNVGSPSDQVGNNKTVMPFFAFTSNSYDDPTAYTLVEGEYDLQIFWGKDKLKFVIFPEFNMVAQDIFVQGQ